MHFKEPSSLSDHSPIMTWLNINTVNTHSAATNINDTLTRLPKQFIWENDSSQKFRAALQSNDLQNLIHDFLIDERPDKRVVKGGPGSRFTKNKMAFSLFTGNKMAISR